MLTRLGAKGSDPLRELATAKRPLVIGIGGGGDVVGALAVAEHCRLFHGANPIVGGDTGPWLARHLHGSNNVEATLYVGVSCLLIGIAGLYLVPPTKR